MKDDLSFMMTPFDQSVSNWSLQMTKLLIPFLPPQNQRMMAVYVKFIEFQNTLSFFRGTKQRKDSPENMFDDIKPYLPLSAQESYNNVINIVNMIHLFQEMQHGFDGDFDPMSMMTDMLTPEQQDMFQMFQNMNVTGDNITHSKEGENA